MLRKIRIVLAAIVLTAITLLFLDFTGALHGFLGFLAKVQFLPALMALNLGIVLVLVLLTFIFGRVYCSVICPLGIFQDVVSRASGMRKKARLRFRYSPEKKWLRYGVWMVFVLALVLGFQALVALIAPYSAYGRIVQNLFSPVYVGLNNLLAKAAAHFGSYAFYTREVWIRSIPTFLVAAATLVLIVVLAWKGGRSWCNTVCPVGTTLSFFSRFALLRPVIDSGKCRDCRVCEKKCKASCIDIDKHKIDYSRCVDCFNCLDNCKFGALKYRFAYSRGSEAPVRKSAAAGASVRESAAVGAPVPESAAVGAPVADTPVKEGGASVEAGGRRAFIGSLALVAGAAALRAQEKKLDGGLADIVPKHNPDKALPLTPAGSRSADDFYRRCTACQLCVSVCPNNVLVPSSSLEHFMQPQMRYDKGYCRPECTKCSQVCPSGAIIPVTPEEKTEYKIGTAHVNLELCVPATVGQWCGNCARHCPVGAIKMVRKDPDDEKSLRIPAVQEEMCIGCGACENLCPSRPVSAIVVEGITYSHIKE